MEGYFGNGVPTDYLNVIVKKEDKFHTGWLLYQDRKHIYGTSKCEDAKCFGLLYNTIEWQEI